MSFVTNLIKQKVNPKTFLDGLRIEDLYSEATFNVFKYAAFSFIDNFDKQGAVEFARKVERLLSAVKSEDKEQQHFSSLIVWWMLRLKVFSFIVLGQQEQNELFKKHILEILRHELDLRGAVFNYIDLFNSGNIIENITQGFISSLLVCEAILGYDQQSFAKADFRPSVGNWLKQYQVSLNKRRLENTKPGAFDLINFMDTGPNVRFLNSSEKEILKSLLILYNELLTPVVYSDEQPVAQVPAYTNSQKFELVKDVLKKIPASPELPSQIFPQATAQQPPKAAPINPSETKMPVQTATTKAEVSPKNIPAKAENEGWDLRGGGTQGLADAFNRRNIQDVLKSQSKGSGIGNQGLGGGQYQPGVDIGSMRMSQGSPPAVPVSPKASQTPPQATIEQDTNLKPIDIDKKLEDLKKKIK